VPGKKEGEQRRERGNGALIFVEELALKEMGPSKN